MIAGCLSLQRLGIDLPVTGSVWDSNLEPASSESRSLATKLSADDHNNNNIGMFQEMPILHGTAGTGNDLRMMKTGVVS